MLKVSMLYRPFHMRKTYKGLNEEKILSTLYGYRADSLEVAVSRIINVAVLEHMNLYIDSTIMQMLALNDYLTHLFMSNLEVLIFNYATFYIEAQGIEVIEEVVEGELEMLSKQVDMKTDLAELIIKLDELCDSLK